jgi:hypothetical protein
VSRRALFDLSAAPDGAFNYHFDCLCKAIAEPPDDEREGGIWEPHPSVYLRSLIEAFTSVGLASTSALSSEAKDWLSGKAHAAHKGGHAPHPLLVGGGNGPHGATGGPPGGSGGGGAGSGAAGGSGAPGAFPLATAPLSWSPEVVAAVREYLLSKELEAFALEDWLLLADYLVHSHFPAGFAEAQGDWLAARAGLMASLEQIAPGASLEQVDNVLAAMPNSVQQAKTLLELSPAHVAAMEYGRVHCAENVRSVTDRLRGSIRSAVLQDLGSTYVASAGGSVPPGPGLQTKLFDLFADFNRDWRRIAVTEAGEIKNQGFIASQKLGSFVKRVERYRGACSFCRNLDGRVFKVIASDDPDKDGAREIWPGKTNVGRSAAPTKRVDGELVPRLPSELWWPAAGVQHPHCRGVWIPVDAPLNTATAAQWKAWLGALGMVV